MRPSSYFQQASLADLRVLRRSVVLELVGLSATRIRSLEAAGMFPQRVALGDNAVGYLEREVRDWLASRAASTTKPTGARAPHAALIIKSGKRSRP